jgi:outer membrane protein OmpA-like peptidoglycan-associated protein
MSEAINTVSHESNATFTRDGKTMYFNRTSANRTKIEDTEIANIAIFKAELIDGAWTNVTALPFNSEAYSTEHPSLSKNGKTLYFSSDMPGGFGGFDIYKVTINSDGTYGEPENLGAKINSSQREQFPYISQINTLYFASNGHEGFGNLDVFRSELVNNNFSNPINLGAEVNTNLDDFGFSINEQKNKGYFSSNREGEDKLYSFNREENILTKYLVEGIVQDKNSNELLPNSLVTLFDENRNVIQDTIVGANATYLFKIEPNKKYTIRGTRKLYIPMDVDFSTDSKGKIKHNIYLTLESYADAEERIKENERGEVQVQLEKIYFDFNKSNIRPDAANILNTLVGLLKKYPYMEIEISSHTDARGPSLYNLELSKKRAASTLEYIVSQGIDRNRLRSIGYGEEQPLNNCIREGICTDKEYDKNRRSEFKLTN